jgi:hypothetical protein
MFTRRRFLAIAGSTVAGLTVAACGEGEGGANETPSPSPSTTPTQEEMDKIAADSVQEHFGPAGREIFTECTITNPAYLDFLDQKARAFRCEGEDVGIQLVTKGAKDVGGIWANDLIFSAPLTTASAKNVADLVRDRVDDSVEPGIAAFGYYRFLDVGASNALGEPILGQRSELIFFPGFDVAIDEPEPDTQTPQPAPTTTPAPLSHIYILRETGIQKIELASDQNHAEPVMDTLRSQRPATLLEELIGSLEEDQPIYYVFKEDPTPVSELDPTEFGWPPYLAVTYTRAEIISNGAPEPETDHSSESTVVTSAAPLGYAQASAPVDDRTVTGTQQQGLQGTPTTTPEVSAEVRYGPPWMMQGPFHVAKNSHSKDSCTSTLDTVWAVSMTANGAGLTACLKFGVPAAAAACGPFFWICGPIAAVACLAAAAAVAYWLNGLYEVAKIGCGQTIPCSDPRAQCYVS